MMTLILIVVLVLILGVIGCLYMKFVGMRKKINSLSSIINDIQTNTDTLYVNQQGLSSDIKKIFNELQNVKKTISVRK